MVDLRIAALAVVSFMAMYMAVFWLLVLLQGRKKLHVEPKAKKFPGITALVPAYNEEDSIRECIESLLKVKYPGKFNIIVINDGSTDDTKKIASEYAKKGLIKLLNKKNGGKASAMNLGIKHAKTPLVACLDADSMVAHYAPKRMVGFFTNKNVAAVTPALKVNAPDNVIQRVQWVEYLVNLLQRRLYALLDVIYVTPGPFTIYRKDVLNEVGGFDEGNLTEDMEIALHIQDKGYTIENAPSADVYTNAPFKMYTLFNQRVRWYRGLVHNSKKYKHMFFSKKHGLLGVFILPATILTILVSIIGAGILLEAMFRTVWTVLNYLYFYLIVGFNPQLEMDLIGFLLSQNIFITIISGIILLTSAAIVYWSHKLSGERFTWSMKLGYAIYLGIYFVLMASVWAFSIFEEMIGVARKW